MKKKVAVFGFGVTMFLTGLMVSNSFSNVMQTKGALLNWKGLPIASYTIQDSVTGHHEITLKFIGSKPIKVAYQTNNTISINLDLREYY